MQNEEEERKNSRNYENCIKRKCRSTPLVSPGQLSCCLVVEHLHEKVGKKNCNLKKDVQN